MAPSGSQRTCPECSERLVYLQRFGEVYVYTCPNHGAVAEWPSGAITLMGREPLTKTSTGGTLKQRWKRWKFTLFG